VLVCTVCVGMYGLCLYVRSVLVSTVCACMYGLCLYVRSVLVCTVCAFMYGLCFYVRSVRVEHKLWYYRVDRVKDYFPHKTRNSLRLGDLQPLKISDFTVELLFWSLVKE
jgi:hypothetical protein